MAGDPPLLRLEVTLCLQASFPLPFPKLTAFVKSG